VADTKIEWTDATWNPVAGCTVISPGCTNCYAMRLASRLEAMGSEKYAGLTRKSGRRAVWKGKIRLDTAALSIPAKWRRPRRIFVNSMSDLFHDAVPTEFIGQVWTAMLAAPQHTFQILTKRPERLSAVVPSLPLLSNVWLGTSVERSDFLWRLDPLRQVLGYTRFVSFEPLLGSVGIPDLRSYAWAIVGGESGPGARPMDQVWVQDIREGCRRSGSAFFFKQWGGRNKARTGRTLDGQTWDEYPITHAAE